MEFDYTRVELRIRREAYWLIQFPVNLELDEAISEIWLALASRNNDGVPHPKMVRWAAMDVLKSYYQHRQSRDSVIENAERFSDSPFDPAADCPELRRLENTEFIDFLCRQADVDPRVKRQLYLRFTDRMKDREIAAREGHTPAQICWARNDALKKLRRTAKEYAA